MNGTATNAREYGGILVGREIDCEIINGSTSGKIVATMGISRNSGGLVGNSGGHITSCWSDAYVDSQESAGGLVGTVEDGIVSDCYKDSTSVLTKDELSIPFGYHLESDWNDISMDDSESFDVYQVINASGTAEKTVQVRLNSVGVTVRFVQGTEDRGTQKLSADGSRMMNAQNPMILILKLQRHLRFMRSGMKIHSRLKHGIIRLPMLKSLIGSMAM